jgi:putative membrane protein
LLALGPGSLIRTGAGATAGSRTGAGTGATDRTGAAAGTGAAVGVGVGVPDAVAGAGSTGVPAGHLAAERLLHAVDNRRLLLGQLLTPHALLLPFAVALTLIPFAYRPTTSFIGLASTITALVGVVQVPARHLLADWNFRVYADPAGLRLRHGLLTIRSETVPRARVQAVSLLWPALWRPLGWLSARMDVAGYGQAERGIGVLSGRLLPIGDAPTARALVAESLGGVDVATLTVAVPPARARWLAPLRQPVIGVGVTPEVVVTRDGWLRRQLVIAPLARVQSVRVVQGPVQRALRLASVHVDTAGGIRAVAEHRDVDEAYALAAMLATASGAARAADRAATR